MTVRMRHTRAHTGNRRAHHKIEKPAIANDGDGVHVRHRVSPTTGMYKGKQVLSVKEKTSKKEVAQIEAKAEEKK